MTITTGHPEVGPSGPDGPGTIPPTPGPPGRGRDRPGRRHRLRLRLRLRRTLTVLGLLVVGFVIWGVVWYQGEVAGNATGAAVIVDVPAGSSVSAVTATLVRQHVVDSSLAFRVFLLLHGTPTVQDGRYQFHQHEGFGAVRDALSSGPTVFPLVVVPGTTVTEVASALQRQVPRRDAAGFLSLATSGTVRSPWQPPGSNNLDGLLGTGTYIVVPGESDAQLLANMVARFDAEAAALDLPAAASAVGLTPYQAVTVASIVQKEAISPGDSAAATAHNAGPVARVVYNRLARGTPLQMDATVLYAENRDGGPVTAADEALATPYNTYLHAGLTPTPICLPSKLALRAALHPPAGDWLYFELTQKDGTETFSDTFAGQIAAEQLAQSRGLP